MTADPDVRVPPLASGTPCLLDGREVRAYARIWPGTFEPEVTYRCVDSERRSTVATREQLQVIEVPRG